LAYLAPFIFGSIYTHHFAKKSQIAFQRAQFRCQLGIATPNKKHALGTETWRAA
jgi:hypothetical protein